jgi:hypothetical protein
MRTLALIPLVLIAACGLSDSDPGPGGETVGEAKALDEAAEMLDQRRLPPEALHSSTDPGGRPSPVASASTTAEGETR